MFRITTLLSIILALAVITAGSIGHFSSTTTGTLAITLHQYMAAALVLTLLGLTVIAWMQRSNTIKALFASIGLLIAQFILGISLLKLQPMPLLTVAHVLLPIILVGLLFNVYLRSQPDLTPKPSNPNLKRLAGIVRGLFILEILLGAWLSANSSPQFALCQHLTGCRPSWWPEQTYQNAVNILYKLLDALHIRVGQEFDAITTLTQLHILVAGIGLVAGCYLALSILWSRHSKPIKLSAIALWLMLALHITIGLFMPHTAYNQENQLVTDSALWFYVSHNVLAALMLLPLVALKTFNQFTFERKALPSDAGITLPSPLPTAKQESITPSVTKKEKPEEVYVEPGKESLYLRLKTQLKKTRSGLGGLLANLSLSSKAKDELLEDIESTLLMADVGMDVTSQVIGTLKETLERPQLNDSNALTNALKQELLSILTPCNQPLKIDTQKKPFVILVVGVNGVGKTTTIGKLAKRLQAQGNSVMLAAGDTFRAAAVEQLQVWGDRNHIHVVAQHTGADSASVIFDAVQSAHSKGIDILIADTAGRLHTKSNLMEELKKVKRIMGKLDTTAPHEVLLVLDAGTGQNALSQAKQFNEAVALTGLVLTKLDGTAKGGIIFALAKLIGVPIRFIGIGEGIDDLQDFNAESFVDALFVRD